MKRIILCMLLALSLIVGAESTSALASSLKSPSGAESSDEISERADKILSGMTMKQKIGQVLLVNFRSWRASGQEEAGDMSELNPEVEKAIGEYHLGNIILFGENVKTTDGAARLTAAMQRAARENGDLPLLIGIDQEGGNVTRLGQGTCLPGNMALGAAGDTRYAYLSGMVIAKELSSVGVNCDFAPDSDVNDNPANPVIGLRSFGSNPALVSDLACSYLNGLKSGGVTGCAKHFPGHGDTSTDTHTGLAIVDKSKKKWLATDAVPFKALVSSGIEMIMSAHIQYPNLDSTRVRSKSTDEEIYLPATLSQAILTDLLRGELGFEGVICTDAMDMQAITDHFGESEAVIMALRAGADLICNPTKATCLEELSNFDKLYEAIATAVSSGELPASRLDEAAKRVIKLKIKSGIIDARYPTGDEQAENAASVVGCAEHRSIEREIAEAAVTFYGQKRETPKVNEGEKTLIAVPYDSEAASASFAVDRLVKEGSIAKIRAVTVCYNKLEKLSDELKSAIKAADRIIVISETYGSTINDPGHWLNIMPRAILEAAKKAGKKNVAVISTGLPYDAVNFPDANVYLVYGYIGMSAEDAESGIITGKYGPNIPAGLGAALGAFEPVGKLPVSVD